MAVRWVEAPGVGDAADLIRQRHGVPPVAATILACMALDEAGLEAFLRPDSVPWPEPSRIPDLEGGAARIAHALRDGERILVHGDYDVDGLMGSAVLVSGLRAFGGLVDAHIPSRFDGGYGLSDSSLEAVAASRSQVVVTTDCGTNAREVGERLRSAGVDLVVSDHHIPMSGEQPPGFIVNPRQEKGHPDGDLCGAAVALQLLRGVASALGRPLALEPFLRLVAIATVADVVPLSAVNRRICKEGFRALQGTPNAALALMVAQAKVEGEVRSHHVSFHMAPRFNAAGRMEDARLVLDLLLERRPERAADLMGRLEALNRRRKALQAIALQEAMDQVSEDHGTRVSFAASDTWHKGVIGPVAARLAETHGRSAFVVALAGGEGVGSARAWPEDNVSVLLDSASDLLVRYGGHSGAAGFTVARENLGLLKSRLMENPPPRGGCNGERRYFPLAVDSLLSAWEAWGLLDPFGPGNPEPSLGLHGVRPRGFRAVGERHLIWDAALPGGETLQVIAWDGVSRGLSHGCLTPSRVVVGRPAPQSRRGGLPFFFSVEAIL